MADESTGVELPVPSPDDPIDIVGDFQKLADATADAIEDSNSYTDYTVAKSHTELLENIADEYATLEDVGDAFEELDGAIADTNERVEGVQKQIDDGLQEQGEIRLALNELADEVENIDGGDGDPIDLDGYTTKEYVDAADGFLQNQINAIAGNKDSFKFFGWYDVNITGTEFTAGEFYPTADGMWYEWQSTATWTAINIPYLDKSGKDHYTELASLQMGDVLTYSASGQKDQIEISFTVSRNPTVEGKGVVIPITVVSGTDEASKMSGGTWSVPKQVSDAPDDDGGGEAPPAPSKDYWIEAVDSGDHSTLKLGNTENEANNWSQVDFFGGNGIKLSTDTLMQSITIDTDGLVTQSYLESNYKTQADTENLINSSKDDAIGDANLYTDRAVQDVPKLDEVNTFTTTQNVDLATGVAFQVKQSEVTNLQLWSGGTVEQVVPQANSKPGQLVNRANLTDALNDVPNKSVYNEFKAMQSFDPVDTEQAAIRIQEDNVTTLKIFPSGLIKQVGEHNNSLPEHIVNRKNLTDALGYRPYTFVDNSTDANDLSDGEAFVASNGYLYLSVKDANGDLVVLDGTYEFACYEHLYYRDSDNKAVELFSITKVNVTQGKYIRFMGEEEVVKNHASVNMASFQCGLFI